ncbi:MAG: restriction endonuclease, partial [Flavobacterium sp.]
AILREKIPSERISQRDTQSYFGVLFDNNNRKPICRFHFNTSKKYIELFHNGKDAGEKKPLNSLDEIYGYREELHQTLTNYN